VSPSYWSDRLDILNDVYKCVVLREWATTVNDISVQRFRLRKNLRCLSTERNYICIYHHIANDAISRYTKGTGETRGTRESKKKLEELEELEELKKLVELEELEELEELTELEELDELEELKELQN